MEEERDRGGERAEGKNTWSRQRDQHRCLENIEQRTDRGLLSAGPGLPQSRHSALVFRGSSEGAQAGTWAGRGQEQDMPHVTGPTLLKCPCCPCGVHWAWCCFIGGLPGDARPRGVCVTSANTPTLGGPVLGLLGCLNLGPSSYFSVDSAGSPGDLSPRPFSANILGLSFSPICRD